MTEIARYVGVMEQVDFNTEATDTSIDLEDSVTSMGLDAPKDPNIAIPTLNRFQQRHIPGFYAPEGTLEANVDVQSVGWFLKWCMGEYKFTKGTGSNPNIHEFWATQKKTVEDYFTCRVGKDTFEHVFIGCAITKLDLSVDKDLADIKWDMLAQKDKKDVLRTSLNTIDPDIFPLAFYNVSTNIDSTEISADVKSWELTFDNGMKSDDKQGQGSRYPYGFLRNPGSIGLTITRNIDDPSEPLEKFWADADGVSENPHDPFSVDSLFDSADFGSMDVKMPQCYYTEVPTDTKGADPIVPKLAIQPEAANILLHDGVTNVLSPVLITLQNYDDEYKLPTTP